jgi:Mg2+ transporter (mgtE)
MIKMLVQDTLIKIQDYLESKNYLELNNLLVDLHAADIADLYDQLGTQSYIILFRLLPKEQAAEVFSHLSASQRKAIVSAIDEGLLGYILDELYFDDKIDFLEEMPSNFVKDIIATAPAKERGLINTFLSYPAGCAGSLMTIEYVALPCNITVAQAMARIKKVGIDRETIYTCYVLDKTRHLEGLISLRKLVLSENEQTIESIMEYDVICARAHDDQEKVAELFKKYDLIALPVVDEEKCLVGIITVDDIVDVIEQENTEDFEKMAAMSPSNDAYLDTGVFKLAGKRIVWLLVLMITATLTGSIITHFESLLSAAVVLTAFIPMLMNSGGNAGSQSSTLIIRGMALGEIQPQDWLKILWKELRVGIIAGFILSVVNFIRLMLLSNTGIAVNLTVSLALFLTVIGAKLVGGILPVAAKAARLDPAIMAGPFITTIVDTFSLVIYFNIAGILVR